MIGALLNIGYRRSGSHDAPVIVILALKEKGCPRKQGSADSNVAHQQIHIN
jgi:hypothetical protein